MSNLVKNLDTPYGTFDFYQSSQIISDDWTFEERLFVASEMLRMQRVAIENIPKDQWTTEDARILFMRLSTVVGFERDNPCDLAFLRQNRSMILWWAGMKDDDKPYRPNGFICDKCGVDMANLEPWRPGMRSIEIGCSVCEHREQRRLL